MDIPKIKRRITSFLVGEEGKISKKALISGGAILSSAVLASLSVKDVQAGHNDYVQPDCPNVHAKDGQSLHYNALNINVQTDPTSGGGTSTHDHCIETHKNTHDSHDSGGGGYY